MEWTVQKASESCEPEIEMVGVVNTVPEESEVLQPTTMSENSPKVVVVSPITPTSEVAVCTLSTEVTEPTIETKEVNVEMEQLAATEENTPVKELVQAICETTMVTLMKETESAHSVVLPSEEVSDEPIQVQETKEECTVIETVEATAADSETSAVIDQASESIEEIKEDIQPASEIETQSMVVAQAVIQDAMAKVSEDASEPKKTTIATPVQAVASNRERG
ncbi:hypothetical protein D5F01_LYC14777 [Larimichthys crocea]|uniref:Uncharacterized protein n=1 Tax=Larimichthys crocea TaxID=215358 RepID=A0A6G0I5W3_LARCR|nr:hypothetical protein D5F01_LYC14777 [Larimichthys crocea]